MRYGPSERLFRLARLLAGTRMGLTLDEMAAELEVGRRTAERLRDSLEAMFPQMDSQDDDARVRLWRLPGSALVGVVEPRAEAVAAIETVAREFEARGESDRAALLREALTTLRAVMRPDALRPAETDIAALMEAEGIAMRPGPRPVIAPGVLTTLRRAILGMQLVVVRYAGPDAEEPATRMFCPYGILYGGRGWLVAHVDGLPEMRLWRLDRIVSIDLLDRVFQRREEFNFVGLRSAGLRGVPGRADRCGAAVYAGGRRGCCAVAVPSVAEHHARAERRADRALPRWRRAGDVLASLYLGNYGYGGEPGRATAGAGRNGDRGGGTSSGVVTGFVVLVRYASRVVAVDTAFFERDEFMLFECNQQVRAMKLAAFIRWARKSFEWKEGGISINNGILALPPIQCNPAWTPRQVIDVWDSVLRALPLGAFMLQRRRLGAALGKGRAWVRMHITGAFPRGGIFLTDSSGFGPCCWESSAPTSSPGCSTHDACGSTWMPNRGYISSSSI